MLSTVVSQLLHLGMIFACVAAKVLLQRWKYDHLPATNPTDDHDRYRLPSYEITRHVNLLSDRLSYTRMSFVIVLCHAGILCKYVADKIFTSALEI